MAEDYSAYPPSSSGYPTAMGMNQGMAQVLNFQTPYQNLVGLQEKLKALKPQLEAEVQKKKEEVAALAPAYAKANETIDAYRTLLPDAKKELDNIVKSQLELANNPNVKMMLAGKAPLNPNDPALAKFKAGEAQIFTLKGIQAQKKAALEAQEKLANEGKLQVGPHNQQTFGYGNPTPQPGAATWAQPGPVSVPPGSNVQPVMGQPQANIPVAGGGAAVNAGVVGATTPQTIPAPGVMPSMPQGLSPVQQAQQARFGYSPAPMDPSAYRTPTGTPFTQNDLLMQRQANLNMFMDPNSPNIPTPYQSVDVIGELAKMQPIVKQTADKIKQEYAAQGYDITDEAVWNSIPQIRALAQTMLTNPNLVNQLTTQFKQLYGPYQNPTVDNLVDMLMPALRISESSQTYDANQFALQNQKAAIDKDLARFKKGLESEVQLSAPDVLYPKGVGVAKNAGPWEVYNFGKPIEKKLNVFDKGIQVLDGNNNTISPTVLKDIMTLYGSGGATSFVDGFSSAVGYVPNQSKPGESQLGELFNFYLPPESTPDNKEIASFDFKTGATTFTDGTTGKYGVPATAIRPVESQEAKSFGLEATKKTSDIAEPSDFGTPPVSQVRVLPTMWGNIPFGQ